MRIKLLLVSGLAALSMSSFAQSFSLAGTVGAYFPSSAEIRSLFGSRLLSFGATPWTGNSTKSGFSPEIGFVNGSNNGNSFVLAPLAVAYEKDFVSENSNGTVRTSTSMVPYLRASLGVAYFDYSITRPSGNHYSLRRVGGTAGLEAGLKLSNTAKLFVKYDKFTTEQHFDFSGLQVGFVLSLVKL